MDGQQQSLAFLKMLTPEAAEDVLARMKPAVADRLRQSLQQTEDVPIDAGRRAISRFEEMLSLLHRSGAPLTQMLSSPELKIASEHAAEEDVEPEEADISGDTPLEQLQSLSTFQIANALRPEQPRITAMLLNELEPEIAANVLALLPEEQQSKVVIEFSANQPAPPMLIERIVRATLNRGQNMPSEPPDDREQIDRLAEMLREVPKRDRSRMINALAQEDADLKERLMSKLYVFDDLPALDSHIRQKILAQVDTSTLVTALYEADQSIIDAVFEVMSNRARGSLEEEMQFQPRVSEEKVEAARAALVSIMGMVAEGGD